ncbi:FHA domain-containing protein [Streptomyces viridochromogenes]|uniref:Putative ABC transporter ATP-binding protein n=1 Tax=Streptomyces viridochromogenes Tue57 TaxID=1160705 RepID=L8P5G6_STRVR|nr:FHA domain-containing protein [Streptomyces viridochromogenes]ELS50557.1 putative ABC transporter ATP-binding protein [Streptomyces viridochromogenes Tue57]
MIPGRDHHVGRDPRSDIVIAGTRVSWHHACRGPGPTIGHSAFCLVGDELLEYVDTGESPRRTRRNRHPRRAEPVFQW